MSVDFDKAVTSVWSSYWHRFMSTGECADESGRKSYESCLTCGAVYVLVNLGDGSGKYVTNGGGEPSNCSGRTDLVHGYERVCENDNGRSCESAVDTGSCEHTNHACDCTLCD